MTFQGMQRGAVFGAGGRYRYSLTRRWAEKGPTVAFVLLNPSTADAHRDDPTIRRCIGFARGWGFAALEVVNLFAFRSTQPAGLRAAPDPVGPENDHYLVAALRRAPHALAAWGVHGGLLGRADAVLALAARHRRRLQCLDVTKAGFPRHVLYLRSGLRPRPYPLD